MGSQQHRAAVGRRFEDAEQHLHHMPPLGPGADVVAVLVESAHPLVRICGQAPVLASADPLLRTQAPAGGGGDPTGVVLLLVVGVAGWGVASDVLVLQRLPCVVVSVGDKVSVGQIPRSLQPIRFPEETPLCPKDLDGVRIVCTGAPSV